jgi:hypothetical protein
MMKCSGDIPKVSKEISKGPLKQFWHVIAIGLGHGFDYSAINVVVKLKHGTVITLPGVTLIFNMAGRQTRTPHIQCDKAQKAKPCKQ